MPTFEPINPNPSQKPKPRKLIAIDLDNTFTDYTAALRDCMGQLSGKPCRAPEPTNYGFVCDGWFGDADEFAYWHGTAVTLGLYLRECAYPHAWDALTLLNAAEGHRLLFATSRTDDGEDTGRWMRGMGRLYGTLDPLYELGDDTELAHRIRLAFDNDWNMAGWQDNGIPYVHLRRKELLQADLYIEDNPLMLDTLMLEGLPVLAKRHGYNTKQCKRLEHEGGGAVFKSWSEVPELVDRILGKE